MYLVVTHFISKMDMLFISISDILENEEDVWYYIGLQVDELSKKDKNPTIVIKQFKKEVVVLIGNHESNYQHPTPSIFIFSIHETHFF